MTPSRQWIWLLKTPVRPPQAKRPDNRGRRGRGGGSGKPDPSWYEDVGGGNARRPGSRSERLLHAPSIAGSCWRRTASTSDRFGQQPPRATSHGRWVLACRQETISV